MDWRVRKGVGGRSKKQNLPRKYVIKKISTDPGQKKIKTKDERKITCTLKIPTPSQVSMVTEDTKNR